MISELQDARDKDRPWSEIGQLLGGERVVFAAFAVLYALLVWAGYEFKESTRQLTLIWPAAGLLLVTLWLAPYRRWPFFIALQAAIEFSVGAAMQDPFRPGFATLFILANTCDAIVGALVARSLKWLYDQVQVQLALKFLLATVCGAAASAMLGAFVAVQSYAVDIGYWHQWQLWWAGNWLGSLVVAPVVYTWAVPTRRVFPSLALRNAWEVPLFLALLVAMTLWVFSVPVGGVASVLQMPMVLVAFAAVAAFRFPPRWATLSAAVTVLVAAEVSSRGAGPFAVDDTFMRLLRLQMFLALLVVVVFLLSVAVAELRIGLARLGESEGRYRSFINLSSEAVWRVELAEPMPVTLPPQAQRDWLHAHAHVAECNMSFGHIDPAGATLEKPCRAWSSGVHWEVLFEQHIEQAAQKQYSLDGLRFTASVGGRQRSFLVSFSGVVVEGHLHRIWGVARDITEIVDLNTRLLREQERLKGYARQLVTAEERARRATAVDLHDGIAQSLVGMAMTLEVAREQAPPEAQVLIDETRANLRQVQDRTRNMIADLSPPGLYELGLAPALQWLAVYFRGQDKLAVQLECRVREDAIPMDLRVLIFKLVRELLRNVVKHANVDNARVTVRGDSDRVSVEVADAGRGFEWQMDLFGERVGGFGLWSISDRINDVGGSFKVDTAPGRGARFELAFPLRRVVEGGGPISNKRAG